MNKVNILKKQVKKYIDNADETVIKMIHAMLEVNAKNDWWDDLPNNTKDLIQSGLKELDEGKGISHEEVKKMHPKWFSNNLVSPCIK